MSDAFCLSVYAHTYPWSKILMVQVKWNKPTKQTKKTQPHKLRWHLLWGSYFVLWRNFLIFLDFISRCLEVTMLIKPCCYSITWPAWQKRELNLKHDYLSLNQCAVYSTVSFSPKRPPWDSCCSGIYSDQFPSLIRTVIQHWVTTKNAYCTKTSPE